MSLKNIDFFRYLPLENSKYYYLPLVNTISTKSFLFHSKMISNIVRSHILKMNKSFNLKPGDLVSTQYIIDEERKKTLDSEIIYNELPNLTINLTNNSLSAWMDLSIDKLNKRGYKINTKQDSLKEDLANAIVVLSGVNKFSKIIWDPFCGCGTIIIESIILKSGKFKRDLSKFKYLNDMKFINEDKDVLEFLNNEFSNENKDNMYNSNEIFNDIKYYASDISPMSYEYSFNNFINSNIYSQDQTKITNINQNPLILKEKINSFTNLLLGDYEKIFKIIEKENVEKNKISILTHLPYKEDNNFAKTIKLYKEFSNFLKKNFDMFESVQILIKKRDKKDNLNFEVISELNWDTIGEFSNEGIDTKLIRLKI